MKYDVTIIGGAAMGLCVAYYLKKMQPSASVCVVERDPKFTLAATPRGSGGLRRLFSSAQNIEMSEFSIRFFEALPRTDVDINWRKNGYLFIVPPKQMAQLERNAALQASHGVRVEVLNQKALKERFPSMVVDDLGGAVQSFDDGWLESRNVMSALDKVVRPLGPTFVTGEVVGFDYDAVKVKTVHLSSGRTIETGAVVNAAGPWAGFLCDMVGWKLPLTAMRRYEHRFETPMKIEPLPYVKDVNRLAFRPEGTGYSGGVPDTGEPRGVNFAVDRGYFQRVVAPALKHRFPAFEGVRETDVWSGLYDMNDLDGNPIIDRWDGGLENYYVISGFSGHGLMHAPASARGLVELMSHGGYRTIDLGIFGWDRVREGVPFSETGIK